MKIDKKLAYKTLVLIIVLVLTCSLDLITKDLAKKNLKDQSIIFIENYFSFTYVENHAIAFGFMESLPSKLRLTLSFLLPIAATFFGFYIIWRMRKEKLRYLIPLFIIIGGAYGNIIDRMLHGFVTDFLHVHYHYEYNFYVFNVADVLVNIGVILIIFQWKRYKVIFNEIFDTQATN
jgi:signal peptidase II